MGPLKRIWNDLNAMTLRDALMIAVCGATFTFGTIAAVVLLINWPDYVTVEIVAGALLLVARIIIIAFGARKDGLSDRGKVPDDWMEEFGKIISSMSVIIPQSDTRPLGVRTVSWKAWHKEGLLERWVSCAMIWAATSLLYVAGAGVLAWPLVAFDTATMLFVGTLHRMFYESTLRNREDFAGGGEKWAWWVIFEKLMHRVLPWTRPTIEAEIRYHGLNFDLFVLDTEATAGYERKERSSQ